MGVCFFFLAIIVSFLTQIPNLSESGIANMLKLVWLLPLGYYCLTSLKLIYNRTLTFFYCFVGLFAIYCFIMLCIKDENYFGSDITNMAISLMVCSVSYCFWCRSGSQIILNNFSASCIILSLLLSSLVYGGFLMNVSLSSIQYAFASKNSMGQLLFNGAVIGMTCFKSNSKLKKSILLFSILWITVVIFMLKSRATLLGVLFVILYFIFSSPNQKVKKAAIYGSIVFILILLFSEKIYDIIINQIVFANRDTSDLNSLSSGRGTLIADQIDKIPDNFFFGSGVFYMDCFPLMMVVQYGIVGAFIVFGFLYKVAKIITIRFKPRNGLNLAVFLLFWSGILNSLFEAQAPFGPGMKMFLLWTCFGFALAKSDKSSLTPNIEVPPLRI